MQTKNHLPSLFTLIVIGLGTILFLGISALLVLSSLVELFNPAGDPATSMIAAFAFGFIAIVLGFCFWFVLQKFRGQETAEQPIKFPFAGWLWGVIPGISFLSVFFGGLISVAKLPWLSWLFLPFLTILVIVPPIWLFFGAASNGIDTGARWRFFSVFGLSMTISPFLMITLEILVLAFIIIAGSIYAVVARPDLAFEIEMLSAAVNSAASEEVIVNLLTPYLTNPTLIAVAIGYIALLVPLIEELLKPLAVWLFARQLDTPAQGFVLGALSGAGFALIESLNAGADGSTSWAVIVGARTGTSVLHILTSALVGWGIASAFKEKRIGRLFGAYFSAVLIHGLWNAFAAGAGLSTIGEVIGKPEWLYTITPALLCGMVAIGIGVVALLIASNRRLRKQSIPTQTTEEVKVESPA